MLLATQIEQFVAWHKYIENKDSNTKFIEN